MLEMKIIYSENKWNNSAPSVIAQSINGVKVCKFEIAMATLV